MSKRAETQGFEPVPDFDPFGDGTVVYGCPECGATYNAGERHLSDCSRRPPRLQIVQASESNDG